MIKVYAISIDCGSEEKRREAELRVIARCLKHLGLPSELDHLPSGAPLIKGHPELKVSVSHSRKHLVLAIGNDNDGPFGVDVETSGRPLLEKVAGRVFSAKEIDLAQNISEGFVKAWTAKEAVYKAALITGVDFINDIRLNAPDFLSAIHLPAGKKFNLEYFSLGTDMVCLAYQGNKFEFKTLLNS